MLQGDDRPCPSWRFLHRKALQTKVQRSCKKFPVSAILLFGPYWVPSGALHDAGGAPVTIAEWAVLLLILLACIGGALLIAWLLARLLERWL